MSFFFFVFFIPPLLRILFLFSFFFFLFSFFLYFWGPYDILDSFLPFFFYLFCFEFFFFFFIFIFLGVYTLVRFSNFFLCGLCQCITVFITPLLRIILLPLLFCIFWGGIRRRSQLLCRY